MRSITRRLFNRAAVDALALSAVAPILASPEHSAPERPRSYGSISGGGLSYDVFVYRGDHPELPPGSVASSADDGLGGWLVMVPADR